MVLELLCVLGFFPAHFFDDFVVSFHGHRVGNNIPFAGVLAQGVVDPDRAVLFLHDLEALVFDGAGVVVHLGFADVVVVERIQRAGQVFLIRAVGNRILFPFFRIGIPHLPGGLVGHLEQGRCTVDFEQKAVVLHRQRLFVALIIDDPRVPGETFPRRRIDSLEHDNTDGNNCGRENPRDQPYKNGFLSHMRYPSLSSAGSSLRGTG